MLAAIYRTTGGSDVLSVEDVPVPEPGPGEVRVRLRVAGVNPTDWKARRGLSETRLPAVLGRDASGTVELSRADGFEGDAVFGYVAGGGYAEFAIASANTIASKPAGLSHEQAATIPVAGIRASGLSSSTRTP